MGKIANADNSGTVGVGDSVVVEDVEAGARLKGMFAGKVTVCVGLQLLV